MSVRKPKSNQLFTDKRGITHFLVPLVVVLLVGMVGTYMLVASHANPAIQDFRTAQVKSSTYTVKLRDYKTKSDGSRCARAKLSYTVLTTVKAKTVKVDSVLDKTSGRVVYPLHATNKARTIWKGTVDNHAVCTKVRSNKAKVNDHNSYDLTQDTINVLSYNGTVKPFDALTKPVIFPKVK